ncbi:MFS transporter [Parabacteroides sp. AD58]|uniref:MFS transporter n=1 Tax=Parabacteroides absconsus TaxID=2951805 RepID=A0ABZ2IH56_9BACT|nr:MFS transporter [Parabacteroides sp. AD58]MCI7286383.1 MFS transporter [Parabacteroides sp.]MCM6902266.1 MFS transporter [Parabacteroides sp. AD58]MDD6950683.1 MFS transporter [Parabacteroides sp.]MDY6254482.1 MFS transporter [Bacteroidales bacterium]
MRRKKTSSSLILIPVMLSFFVMGFVDLVGVAANHMQADFALSDTMANLCPAMVFLWFLLFSIPAGILMNYIGRRKTVLLSLFITTVSLLIPLLHYEFVMMLISFSLLGIGNVLLQVSLNPLVSNVVSERHLASSLSFGQFIKGIASFLAPFIASWAALTMDEWRELYPIFLLITLVSIIGLGFTSIEELDDYSESDSLKSYGRLLGNPLIRLIWIGIICHVGIDVGINLTAPKIFVERLGFSVADASMAGSVYFLSRTIGCLIGAVVLQYIASERFFRWSVFGLLLALIGLSFASTLEQLYAVLLILGIGNANIFSILISKALNTFPDNKNEVSGLMITGLCGGALFVVPMGIVSDWIESQAGALIILGLGAVYLTYLSVYFRKHPHSLDD